MFYTFVAVTGDEQEAHVPRSAGAGVVPHRIPVRSIASTNTGGSGHVEVRAELVGDQRWHDPSKWDARTAPVRPSPVGRWGTPLSHLPETKRRRSPL